MTNFEFEMLAVATDPTGYYFPRWDRAEKITVITSTRQDAIAIANKMLGKEPRGWGWGFKFQSIKQVKGGAE